MARKLILGIFLASLLLLTNLTFAGERSSPAPAVTKMAEAPSDCDCLKKKSAVPSPGLRPDVLVKKPNRMVKMTDCPPPCYWTTRYVWVDDPPHWVPVRVCVCHVFK